MIAQYQPTSSSIQILGRTLESGSMVYLVSVDGDHPEPMSISALVELVRPPQYLTWRWDEVTRSNSWPVVETINRETFKFLDEPGPGRRSVRVR